MSDTDVTIGPIEHSNSMCQKDGCTCWCQACERHNWRHARTDPDDLRQMAVDALVRRVAELDIQAWQRDGEEVVTVARTDIDNLLSITTRARQLTRTRQRIARR